MPVGLVTGTAIAIAEALPRGGEAPPVHLPGPLRPAEGSGTSAGVEAPAPPGIGGGTLDVIRDAGGTTLHVQFPLNRAA